jgi:hypothetical protein
MILKPDFILPFGKNKGYELFDIYQYDPSYLDWLIEFIPDFEIEIEEFYKLPKPTIFYKPYKLKTSHGYIEASLHIHYGASVGEIRETGTFKPIDFKFSEKSLMILLEKKSGNYNYPHWEPIKFGITIPIKDLLKPPSA